MSLFVESGIELDLTGKPHFRFTNLKAYQAICGQHVQEMDYCWIYNDELILLEVKSYSEESDIARQAELTPDKFTDYLVQKTVPKIWDSLLMLSACWLSTQKGLLFRCELSDVFHTLAGKIRIVIVVDLPDNLKTYFPTIRDRFQTVSKGKLALFDCKNLIVCMPQQLAETPLKEYVRLAVVPSEIKGTRY